MKGEAAGQVEPGVRVARAKRKRFPDQIDGSVMVARLAGQDAKVMQRIGVVGLARKHLAVKRLGVAQPPRLVAANRFFQERNDGRIRNHSIDCSAAST